MIFDEMPPKGKLSQVAGYALAARRSVVTAVRPGRNLPRRGPGLRDQGARTPRPSSPRPCGRSASAPAAADPGPPRSTATPPGICPFWKGSRRSASARACTSGRPTPAGSCTACGRSSTTRSTRRWPATCTEIEVILHADGSVEVRDNGRGIPVDIEPKTGLTGVEVVFTKLHAGGKFGGGSYAASGGLHGVGASVVNALSDRLDVEVDRDGNDLGDELPPRRARRVRRATGPDASSRAARACASVGKVRQGGDRHPDPVLGRPPDLHPGRRAFSFDELLERARQTAFLVPGLAHRRSATSAARGTTAEPRTAEFRYDGGIGEFCDFLAPDEPVTDVLRLTGSGQFTETVPVLDDAGPHDADRGRARAARSTSRCAGAPATTPSSGPSSTSSRRPRAAPTHRLRAGADQVRCNEQVERSPAAQGRRRRRR